MAEPQKAANGETVPDNIGQAAGQRKSRQKRRKASRKAGGEKGTEAAANAAAATVKAGVEGGKAVAENRSRSQPPAVQGCDRLCCMGMRHTLFKILVCLCLSVVFPHCYDRGAARDHHQ